MTQNLASISIQPDAEPTLQTLKEKGVKCGLVTQYSHEVARRIISRIGISDYFDTIVGFEDSDEQKPSPKPVLIALGKLNSIPERSVFVGDMKQDVLAGHNAGVWTVGVYRGKVLTIQGEMLQEAKTGSDHRRLA